MTAKEYLGQYQDLSDQISEEIHMIISLKRKALDLIEMLPNLNERLVVMYRYVNGMSWGQISKRLHADRETIRRWHDAALRHAELLDGFDI